MGPYLILWPFLVSWSIPPVSPARALCPETQNTSPNENLEYHQLVLLLSHLRGPLLQRGRTTSPAAQGSGVVGISLGPPEMLQKAVLEKPSTTLGELENSS